MASLWYRVVQIAYVTDIENEDGPGSLTNPVQHTSSRVTHTLNYGGDLKELDAERFGLYADKYPVRDYDDALGPAVDDTDFSYVLEVKGDDGKWTFVKHLDPIDVEDEEPSEPDCIYCNLDGCDGECDAHEAHRREMEAELHDQLHDLELIARSDLPYPYGAYEDME